MSFSGLLFINLKWFQIIGGGCGFGAARLGAGLILVASWTLLLALPARADLTLLSITQTPPNLVAPGQTVSYDVTVQAGTSPTATNFPEIEIFKGGQNVSDQFSSFSCSPDGPTFFCSGMAPGEIRTLTFSWTPPDGISSLQFAVACSFGESGETITASCAGDSGTVTTEVRLPAPGVLAFTATPSPVAETVGSASYTVSRSGGSDGAVSVDFASADLTAGAGSDYTQTSGTLTWADGDAGAKTITVPILDDQLGEPDEEFRLALSNPTGGATLGSPSQITQSIQDDDANGSLRFETAAVSTAETAGSVTVRVLREGGSDGAVAVTVGTADGTAGAGADYQSAAATLNWADGDAAPKTFTVSLIDDALVEADETFQIQFTGSPTGGATLGDPTAVTVTVTSDDVAQHGVLQFQQAAIDVAESATALTVGVTRVGGSDGAVSVQVTSSDAGAVAGSDYGAVARTLAWADGESGTRTFTVAIIDDGLPENAESFSLTLSGPAGGAALGSPATATVTIAANDLPVFGRIQFRQASFSVAENGGSLTVEVVRVGGADGVVSARVGSRDGSATAGSDYEAVSAVVSWANGDAGVRQVSIPIVDDTSVEGNESFTLVLGEFSGGAGAGSPATATVTIVEDDLPRSGEIIFDRDGLTVDEDAGTVNLTVLRRGGSDGPASVRCVTAGGTAGAGADFAFAVQTLSWADGDAAARSCTLTVQDDTLEEDAETVVLALEALAGTRLGEPSRATLTINPSDRLPRGVLEFEQAEYGAGERDGAVSVRVLRRGGSAGAVAVGFAATAGSATAGEDFQAVTGTLNWADGDAEPKTFTVGLVPDGDLEQPETVNLVLSDPQGGAVLGRSQAVLTIQDQSGFSNLPGLTPRQAATAAALDSACLAASGELAERCRELAGLDDAQLRAALDGITPGQIAGLGNITLDTLDVQFGNLDSRFRFLRGGGSGLALNELYFHIRGQSLPAGALLAGLVRGGGAGDDGDLLGGRLGVFINGRVNTGDKDSTGNETGFDFDTLGLTLGADYRLTEQFVLGGALGYADTRSDFAGAAGKLDAKVFSLSLYGTYYAPGSFYVDWIASLGRADYDTARTIRYSGFAGTASGEADGSMLGLAVSAGADVSRGEWLFSPYARVEYMRAEIDPYRESGGAGLALRFDDQTVTSLTTALGARVSRTIGMSWGVLVPGAHLEWEHEFRDDRRTIDAAFAAAPEARLALPTDEPDRDHFNVGVGVSAVFARGRSAFITVESVLGQDDVTDHTIEAGVRLEF